MVLVPVHGPDSRSRFTQSLEETFSELNISSPNLQKQTSSVKKRSNCLTALIKDVKLTLNNQDERSFKKKYSDLISLLRIWKTSKEVYVEEIRLNDDVFNDDSSLDDSNLFETSTSFQQLYVDDDTSVAKIQFC